MNRRTRWIVIACVAILGIGVSAYGTFFRGYSSQDCAPVVELLDFNRQQNELISTQDANDAVPGLASDAAYQQWADGLAQRAQEVSNPDLAAQAIDLADLASQFVTKLPLLRAETAAQQEGAPPPQVTYEMDVLNTQIQNQLAELSDACA